MVAAKRIRLSSQAADSSLFQLNLMESGGLAGALLFHDLRPAHAVCAHPIARVSGRADPRLELRLYGRDHRLRDGIDRAGAALALQRRGAVVLAIPDPGDPPRRHLALDRAA